MLDDSRLPSRAQARRRTCKSTALLARSHAMIVTSVQVRVVKRPSSPTNADAQADPSHQTPQMSDDNDGSTAANCSESFAPSMRRLQQLAHKRIQYPAFRESFFYDESVNPVLKGQGWEPDPMSVARESHKLWSSHGRSISSRLPKTAVPPGSAFRNECTSPDRLYSSSRGSLGYEVTRAFALRVFELRDQVIPAALVLGSLAHRGFCVVFEGSLRGSSLCSTTKRFDEVRIAVVL